MSAWALARAFFLEAARSRMFYVAIGFAVVLIGVSFLIGPIALGTGDKITRDMGLASLLVCGALMISTGCVHLIGHEIERKTAFLFLTRPIYRAEYILGKFMGVVLTAWTVLAMTAVVFAGALLLRGDAIDGPLLQQAALSAAELVVLSAAVVFFASVAGPVAAMLYAFGLFVAGHTMASIISLSIDATTGLSRMLLDIFKWATPDLSRFDMRLNAVHGIGIEGVDVLWSIGYAIIYSAAILAIACAAFERRELK